MSKQPSDAALELAREILEDHVVPATAIDHNGVLEDAAHAIDAAVAEGNDPSLDRCAMEDAALFHAQIGVPFKGLADWITRQCERNRRWTPRED